MDSTRTISELKSAFIWSQVRILSENLQPPENWRDYAVELEEEALPEKVIEDVLHKGENGLLHCNSCNLISVVQRDCLLTAVSQCGGKATQSRCLLLPGDPPCSPPD